MASGEAVESADAAQKKPRLYSVASAMSSQCESLEEEEVSAARSTQARSSLEMGYEALDSLGQQDRSTSASIYSEGSKGPRFAGFPFRKTTGGSVGRRRSSNPEDVSSWGDAAGQCSLCNAALGKRHLRPRHHCRVCRLAVCAACSPNTLRSGGDQKAPPQRICLACTAGVALGSEELRDRMARLAEQLWCVARSAGVGPLNNDVDQCQASQDGAGPRIVPGDLTSAVASCEEAFAPLAILLDRQRALDAEIRELRADLAKKQQANQELQLRLETQLAQCELPGIVDKELVARHDVKEASTPAVAPVDLHSSSPDKVSDLQRTLASATCSINTLAMQLHALDPMLSCVSSLEDFGLEDGIGYCLLVTRQLEDRSIWDH